MSAPIRTRERLADLTLEQAKEQTDAKLGTTNPGPIGEHAAGSLKVKSVTVDGTPDRWRVLYEWEPV